MVFILATPARADITPFYTFNRSLFAQLHGTPPLDGADTVKPGRGRLDVVTDITSHFFRQRRGNEEIRIDMESYRSTLLWRYGLDSGLEVGLDVPFEQYNAGVLDNVIDRWHGLFGFPDGGRDKLETQRFEFNYRRNGVSVVDMHRSGAGLSDMRLIGAWRLYRGTSLPRRTISLRGSIKLNHADYRRLFGSGGYDGALSAHWQEHRVSGRHIWSWFARGGGMLLGEAEVLRKQQENVVWFSTVGFGWYALRHIELKAQLDANSAFYRSRLTQLGSSAMQFVFGTGIRLNRHWMIDVGVAEDVFINSVPDVNFHFRLSRRI